MRPRHLAPVVAALAAALVLAPAPAQAVTVTRSPDTLTITVDANGEGVTVAANATHYLVTAGGVTTPHDKSSPSPITRIIVDGNSRANTEVVLDGQAHPLVVPLEVRVKNLPARGLNAVPMGNAIKLHGEIRVTGATGQDSVLALGTGQAQPGQGAPITLIGDTHLAMDVPQSETGFGSFVTFGGPVDGAHALRVEQAGSSSVPVAAMFESAVGATTPLASLSVDSGYAAVADLVAVSGTQQWQDTEMQVPEAGAVLRASRVTGTGPIGCQGASGACATTADLTIDVSEVMGGSNPGSSIGGVGSVQYGPDADDLRRIRLVKAGSGTLSLLSGGYANRHSGGTYVDAGVLRAGHAAALGTGSTVIAATGTVLTTTGLSIPGSLTVDGVLAIAPAGAPPTSIVASRLGGTGAIRCGLPGPAGNCGEVVVEVSDMGGATVFGGGFGGVTGILGNMAVTKAGPGTIVLGGTSTITGHTIVRAGEMRVTGSIGRGLSAGNVTVEAGARLSGSGNVGGDADSGGLGMSVAGTVDLDGASGPEAMSTAMLDLAGGALEVGVDGPAAHSQLQVSNAVTLAAGAVLRVRAGSGIPDGTGVVIVRKSHGDPVGGTFAGLPEGATMTPASGPGSFRITYAGGDGNDIALAYSAPPALPAPPAPPPSAPSAGGAASANTGGATARGPVAPLVRATLPRLVGSALSSSVTVDGPGRIVQVATLSGRRRGAAACRAARSVRVAGTYAISCPLSAAARAARARGPVRVTTVTTFTPAAGRATSTRAALTLAPRR